MTDRNFTTAFTIEQTPEAAFAAITDVRGWWSQDIDGPTDQAGKAFKYRFHDIHRCEIQVTELVPGRKVAWLVLDNDFNFTQDKSEWKGTEMIFDISRKDNLTEVRLTHRGLVPEYECYDACSNGWTTYVNGSLRDLIVTGTGQPNVGQPMNDTERALAS
ncbi:MAG TPA: SRPBCC domain-containing protein [Pararhizobium sp.]|uniref:SRPBCC family protein n=1 Tax=Pararhizobium sp. TaxID=1977563 RepID=UPI002CEB07C1|nr:SRPBCC domain-containing protein [Pararhizobium sp.]HTO32022.1 SRPBCC domain-containing protein [Pararhizobium sp.]